jgi:hypothetical protein
MAGTCFERYGVSLGPDASQYCSYAKVQKGSDYRNREAKANFLKRFWTDQSIDRCNTYA